MEGTRGIEKLLEVFNPMKIYQATHLPWPKADNSTPKGQKHHDTIPI
jgi:hypothetical protein